MRFGSIGTSGIIVVLLTLFVSGVSARDLNGVEILQGNWRGEPVEYLDGEILVGLHAGFAQNDLLDELGSIEVSVVRNADRFGFLKLKVKPGQNLFETIEAVANLSSVRYAEPNMVDQMFVIPNDPEFDKQWHYHNTGQNPPGGTPDADIDAPEGWDITTGGTVVRVGVLDSGIPMQGGALSHPDLDDPTRYFLGYDFSYGDNEPADDNGHGTHVSGTIAAETDNAVGVAGVCWNAEILAIKVFDQYGSGSHENFRDGCIYATDNGCKVINYSGGGSAGATKEHGVAYADTHGVVVCAAAGNNWQGSVSWPGAYSTSYTNVICVSATNHHDQSSPFSSIGPEVTISAPGGHGSPYNEDDVYSTFPNYQVQLNIDLGLPQNYSPLAGTSMATPHVAGFAALILSVNPSLAPDSVRQLMMNTSDDLGPSGFDNQFGWGRINVFNALTQMKGVSITHTPLTDTKDSLNSYETICTIISDTLLAEDSLLLRYQVSSIWYSDTLTPTGGMDEYSAIIPAQSPGTVIDYYLFAANARGDADSTDVFQFRVIDYALAVSPEYQSASGVVDDTIWHSVQVTNEGVYSDQYDLSVQDADWTTLIWDETGTIQISQTPALAADESYAFYVSVEIPTSLYGDNDSISVTATSVGDPLLSVSVTVNTISEGEPFSIPFSDNFPTSEINVGKWPHTYGIEVSTLGSNEPSPEYSLNLDGGPTGSDTIVSQAIDLSGESAVVVKYYYQRTGNGDSPEAGDDLYVEYLNSSMQWVTLQTHLGDGPDMLDFELIEITLPPGAYHELFKLRIVSTGTTGAYDDWFVDDVYIGTPSDYDVKLTPAYAQQYGPAGDSALFQLIIHNKGLYDDSYSLADSASVWDVSFWDAANTVQITSTGIIQPSDSEFVLVKIEVPADTPLNVTETSWVIASSNGDPAVRAMSLLEVISAGSAAAFPWSEPFPDATVDMTRWMSNTGGTITTEAYSPPSEPYSLDLDGGGDTLVSQLIDLSGQAGAILSYHFQRTGPGESPDNGDDLVFEYRNMYGEWIITSVQLGSGDDMTVFESVSVPLPSDAIHNALQLRVSATGSGEGYDNWYVDDISLDHVPSIDIYPLSFSFNLDVEDSADAQLIVSNAGPGTLTYSAAVLPVLDKSSVFSSLLASGIVEPARHEYPEGYLESGTDTKGIDNAPRGADVLFDAGGPDVYGYYWIDSDEPDGPLFDWMDIQATGTEVIGLEDDNFVGPFDIGFEFSFYGETYTEFYVASNGYIGFGPTDGYNTVANVTLPNSGTPNNILAWCWDDLNPLDADNPDASVYYELSGSDIVIQFVNYPEFNAGPGDVINAEVIIEPNGVITYQYLTIDPGFDVLGSTVGIENADGTDGLTVVYNSDYLHDSLTVRFYAPPRWLEIDQSGGSIPPDGADTIAVTARSTGLDEGYYESIIRVISNDPDSADADMTVPADLTVSAGPTYICGDADGSQEVDIDDVVYIIQYIFAGGPAPDPMEAGDVDCSGAVDIDDAVYLIQYIFQSGPEPCADCP